MSSFFIRDNNKVNLKPNKFKRKGKVHLNKHTKNKRLKKPKDDAVNDEEISSDEDELININKKEKYEESDEESQLTAQEKKVKLAKQYLKELEDEEREKLDTEDVNDDLILGRLHDEVLSQAGKLRKKVFDKILTEYRPEEFHRLSNSKLLHKPITCLVFSVDNHLFMGSKDCCILKWSLIDMIVVGKIPSRYKFKDNETLPSSPIAALAISSDNKYLASCDQTEIIQVWDPKTLSHLFSFKGHTASVTGLAFCKSSQNLYSCSKDRTVKVWSLQERAYLETLFGHHMAITDIDVISNNRVVTSGGTDNSVRVWKIQEESHLIYTYSNRSIDGVVRLDDHHFISYGDDGAIAIWSVTKKKPLHVIKDAHGIDPTSKEPRWITSIATISNSEVFASGSSDGFVKIWRCDDNFRGVSILAHIPVVGFINALAFTQDFRKLVIGVGQEHKLGRWTKIKEVKNHVLVVQVRKLDE